MPIHAIKNNQDDVLLPLQRGVYLQLVDFCLVKVLCLRIKRSGRYLPKHASQPTGTSVQTVRALDRFQRDSKRVNRYQPIGVRRPVSINVWTSAPVAPAGATTSHCGILQVAQVIRRDTFAEIDEADCDRQQADRLTSKLSHN